MGTLLSVLSPSIVFSLFHESLLNLREKGWLHCSAGQVVSTDCHNSFSGCLHDVSKFVPLHYPISKVRFVALNIWKLLILLQLGKVQFFPNAVQFLLVKFVLILYTFLIFIFYFFTRSELKEWQSLHNKKQNKACFKNVLTNHYVFIQFNLLLPPTSVPNNLSNNQAVFVRHLGGTKFWLVSFPFCNLLRQNHPQLKYRWSSLTAMLFGLPLEINILSVSPTMLF